MSQRKSIEINTAAQKQIETHFTKETTTKIQSLHPESSQVKPLQNSLNESSPLDDDSTKVLISLFLLILVFIFIKRKLFHQQLPHNYKESFSNNTNDGVYDNMMEDQDSSGKFNKTLTIKNSFIYSVLISIFIAFYFLVLTLIFLFEEYMQLYNEWTLFGNYLRFIECILLALFIIDAILSIYSSNFKVFQENKFIIPENILIIANLVLLILQILTELDTVVIIRGIIRLLRVLVILRKILEYKILRSKEKIKTRGLSIKSGAEKIMEILGKLRQLASDEALIKDINWCMDKIANNKLYETIIDVTPTQPSLRRGITTNIIKGDVSKWVENYSQQEGNSYKNHGSRQKQPLQKISKLNAEWNSQFSVNQIANIPEEITKYFNENIHQLDFDPFMIDKLSGGESLQYAMVYLFEKNDLFEALDINSKIFANFMVQIQNGYHDNPYHNRMHALDVAQTTNYILKTGNFIEVAELDSLEIAIMYIAAAIHDYDHKGVNNQFHVNTSTELALRYNDRAVLENHHISYSFTLMKNENSNFIANFSREDSLKFRERVIALVLATDMSQHFVEIGRLKTKLNSKEFDVKGKDKYHTMELLIHAADIGNPMKKWDKYFDWTERILQEFFEQGDQERKLGLPINQLGDRYTVNVSKAQIGFIKVIVEDTFETIHRFLPNIKETLVNLQINKEKWQEKIEEYDLQLKEINEHRKKQEEEENKQLKLKQNV